MLRIAGQTAGPIGLTFFGDTHGWPGKFFFQFFFHFISTSNAEPFMQLLRNILNALMQKFIWILTINYSFTTKSMKQDHCSFKINSPRLQTVKR